MSDDEKDKLVKQELKKQTIADIIKEEFLPILKIDDVEKIKKLMEQYEFDFLNEIYGSNDDTLLLITAYYAKPKILKYLLFVGADMSAVNSINLNYKQLLDISIGTEEEVKQCKQVIKNFEKTVNRKNKKHLEYFYKKLLEGD